MGQRELDLKLHARLQKEIAGEERTTEADICRVDEGFKLGLRIAAIESNARLRAGPRILPVFAVAHHQNIAMSLASRKCSSRTARSRRENSVAGQDVVDGAAPMRFGRIVKSLPMTVHEIFGIAIHPRPRIGGLGWV